MVIKSWLFSVVLFETFIYVYGWGPAGHSTIVRLAQSQLSDTAPEWILSLTPWHWHGNLSALASWADDILYPNTNPTGYDNWQWSRPLHYINIPDWSCNYNHERDCVGDICVSGAIKNYTKRLETELDDIQQREALYFLIHFVGDIHQPLHTGFASDRGGNDVKGHYMNGTYLTNLHSLWDSGLLTTRLHRDFHSNASLYYDHIYKLMINLPSEDNDNNIEQWIDDNIKIVCEHIYFDENNITMNATANFTLGEVYYNRSISIIEQRLARGGRRLGVLLNQLAKTRPQKSSDQKNKLSSSTIALIVILVVEGILAIAVGIIFFIRYKKRSWEPNSFALSSTKE
ncbi:unnamed protein product [Adineta steineri]|uniref:Uncharacterized protein n=1 Tax=Adineta steineri TaxID=433720 RepID=A0A813YMQ6_9BILA|nr:unnamed protein product [Adineta steineri]CAF3929344.1 unnamed protein product [Adineta steineri]